MTRRAAVAAHQPHRQIDGRMVGNVEKQELRGADQQDGLDDAAHPSAGRAPAVRTGCAAGCRAGGAWWRRGGARGRGRARRAGRGRSCRSVLVERPAAAHHAVEHIGGKAPRGQARRLGMGSIRLGSIRLARPGPGLLGPGCLNPRCLDSGSGLAATASCPALARHDKRVAIATVAVSPTARGVHRRRIVRPVSGTLPPRPPIEPPVVRASCCRAAIRLAVFGWVENRLSMRSPLSGLTMNICAVAGLRSAASFGIWCAAVPAVPAPRPAIPAGRRSARRACRRNIRGCG